ncbi:MDR family MFS transporter [Labrys wisconsinensis]|uniref:EmrB/QacA subfamily drug resistance transporter n=1 Tax=Labrys wisconsinensis TaxID=425677 RepID=A0ABU0IZ63_9HYPH|nr:MDR family MFS transporter [Labrys wisconsinensis]MDQ0467304.1 EmrB/QacA subfamily drug resistance transporter [Labrys wisconsinensis]
MSEASQSAVPAPEAAPPTRREIRAVFLGLMIVLALGAIDQSIVATALPRIVGDLGGVEHLSWVVTAYVLTSTTTMPLYGRLSDQYGRKPMIYAAILIFLLGSVLSGAAQTLVQLILFRAVQGIGAGGLMPLAQIIIGDLVPPARRGRQQGAIVAVMTVCTIIGPVLGGLITDLLSWHWIFYVNLPIGAAALAVIARTLPSRRPAGSRRIDYAGAALLTTGTTAFLLALTLGGSRWPWLSPEIGLAAGTALACLVLFVRHIGREPEPVLPPALFANRLFLVACLVLALTFMGLLGASLFFPLFFQAVMGASPSSSGLLTAPLMVGLVISSVFNGRVLLRSGRYKPAQLVGLAVAVTAFATLAWGVADAWGLTAIEPAMLLLGLGLGLVMPNMTIAVQNALPTAHRGVGTAALAFFRSLGGLVGVAGAGAILAWRLRAASLGVEGMPAEGGMPHLTALAPETHAALVELYRHAIATTFAVGTGVAALGLVALLFLPELPLRAHHEAAGRPAAEA